jgi:uncharacterized protein
MMDWFQRLMPHTLLFFPLFERHATTVTAAAEALRQMLEGGEHALQHCRDVLRYEEEADGITREVLIGIRTTFITPFDRGDIKDLITSLDDAIDEMQRTPKAIVLFELTPSSRICAPWRTPSCNAYTWSPGPCRFLQTSAGMQASSMKFVCR